MTLCGFSIELFIYLFINFCIGHTSPSLDDDDYTDGRDSLSQVSTSEQSETDDIRNFESYVEEFNHHKAKAATNESPLHCPFPSMKQPTNHTIPKLPQQTSLTSSNNRVASNQSIPVLPQPGQLGKHSENSQAQTDDFADFKSVSLTMAHPPSSSSGAGSSTPALFGNKGAGGGGGGQDDFDDFKSATPSTSTVSPSLSQIKNQNKSATLDKYGALRSIDEDDLMTSSVFESPLHGPNLDGEAAELSGAMENNNQNGQVARDDDDDDDEWANFAEAPTTSSDGNNVPNNSGGDQSRSTKDDILKLFAAGGNTATGVSTMIDSSINEGSGEISTCLALKSYFLF